MKPRIRGWELCYEEVLSSCSGQPTDWRCAASPGESMTIFRGPCLLGGCAQAIGRKCPVIFGGGVRLDGYR